MWRFWLKILSSTDFLLCSTVRGLCRPEDRSNKIKQRFLNWWSKCYFVTLLFPLFHSCMLLQITLPWSKLFDNEARNVNYSYIDNNCKKITCISRERTVIRNFMKIIKIIKITVSVNQFPKELNQKLSQYPNWSRNYKLSDFNLTLNLFSAFHNFEN